MQTIQGIILVIGVVFAHSVSAKLTCDLPPVNIPNDWITMADPCTKKMREQVQEELTAAMTYMAMGAYFSRDTVNRPGFSQMFFQSASEERDHAIKIIEYLMMRGELTSEISKLIKDPRPNAFTWDGTTGENGVNALKDALKLEAHVTKKIREIIIACEKPSEANNAFNDYHLVDYLTADFLEEQYQGQRDLAGKISTLGKMMDTHGPLGEFLFDKKLLNGSPL